MSGHECWATRAAISWILSEKKPPIEFTEATRQDDVFDIKLPPGYTVEELPAAVHVSCNYGTYDAEVEFKDGALHYTRSYVIKDIVVPTEKLGEVNDFLRKILWQKKARVA